MATRKNIDDKLTLEALMYCLKDNEATEESPTDVTTLSVELDKTPAEVMTTAKDCPILIGVDRIFVWLKYPDEAVSDQLADLQGLKLPTLAIETSTPAPKVVAKKTVDATPNVPVESSQDNKEEDDDVDTNETPEIPYTWENPVQETHFVPFDADNVTGHMIMPEPDSIPAPPEGVNPNVWELAYTATTKPARMYWYKQAKAQMLAYREAQKSLTEETIKPVEEKPRPIDPETGQPFPF